MSTIFLRFSDEQVARSAMADYYSAEDGWNTASLVHALDPVGRLYSQVEVAEDELPPYPEPVAVEGWHINFIGELPDAAAQYVISPATPARVFAGIEY